MKFAGDVTAVLGKRLLVLKSDAGQLPPLYAEVANEQSKPVGKIVDLYGSVAHPYLTVLCNDGALAEVGETLYVIPESVPKNDKRHRRTGFQGGKSRHQKSEGSIWKVKSRS